MRLYKLIVIVLVTLFFSTTATAGIVVLNGLSHAHKMLPGEVYTGEIVVQNAQDSEQQVKLYLRDYLFYKTGEIQYDEPSGRQSSNTSWIKLSPTNVTLSPKEKKVIAYEIKVPETLPKEGTFWSVVMLESVQKLDETSAPNNVQINTQVRYAIQLITHIGNEFHKKLQISGVQLAKLDNTALAVVDVENVGNYLLTPHISLELFDGTGNSVGVFKSEKRKTFPGTSLRFKLPLQDIPKGDYKALLLADCDAENVYGMNLNLSL